MIELHTGDMLNTKAMLRVYTGDCLGTSVPAEYKELYPAAYDVYERLIEADSLVPGDIVPVQTFRGTVILAMTKLRGSEEFSPENYYRALAFTLAHAFQYGHARVALQVEDDLDRVRDVLAPMDEKFPYPLELWVRQ